MVHCTLSYYGARIPMKNHGRISSCNKCRTSPTSWMWPGIGNSFPYGVINQEPEGLGANCFTPWMSSIHHGGIHNADNVLYMTVPYPGWAWAFPRYFCILCYWCATSVKCLSNSGNHGNWTCLERAHFYVVFPDRFHCIRFWTSIFLVALKSLNCWCLTVGCPLPGNTDQLTPAAVNSLDGETESYRSIVVICALPVWSTPPSSGQLSLFNLV